MDSGRDPNDPFDGRMYQSTSVRSMRLYNREADFT